LGRVGKGGAIVHQRDELDELLEAGLVTPDARDSN